MSYSSIEAKLKGATAVVIYRRHNAKIAKINATQLVLSPLLPAHDFRTATILAYLEEFKEEMKLTRDKEVERAQKLYLKSIGGLDNAHPL